ncbi:MAG: roadblock/LC7 domain-containing protein [Candidatus Thorarchaeota archaeon]|nr:roadblock/LC7 domain-containing protein [Candidatus Thorarchaeota archaeon]
MADPNAMKIRDSLGAVLKELSNKSPILGAAIFSVEGLPLVSHFHAGTEEVTVAAMVAGIHAAGEQTVKELRQGDLKSIIIQGDFGTTLVISISPDYILTVTAPENAALGLIFSDAKRTARDARKILHQNV